MSFAEKSERNQSKITISGVEAVGDAAESSQAGRLQRSIHTTGTTLHKYCLGYSSFHRAVLCLNGKASWADWGWRRRSLVSF